jgi:hypothetical protein
MAAHDLPAFRLQGALKGLLHGVLGGPASLVGGETEVAAGDELDVILRELGRFHGREMR